MNREVAIRLLTSQRSQTLVPRLSRDIISQPLDPHVYQPQRSPFWPLLAASCRMSEAVHSSASLSPSTRHRMQSGRVSLRPTRHPDRLGRCQPRLQDAGGSLGMIPATLPRCDPVVRLRAVHCGLRSKKARGLLPGNRQTSKHQLSDTVISLVPKARRQGDRCVNYEHHSRLPSSRI